MMTPLLAALVLSQAGPVDDATAKAQVESFAGCDSSIVRKTARTAALL